MCISRFLLCGGKDDRISINETYAQPVEIKSGKDYTRHAALDNFLGNRDYAIPEAYVFHNGNVYDTDAGRVVYYPMYMLMFLQRDQEPEAQIYRVNLSGLE